MRSWEKRLATLNARILPTQQEARKEAMAVDTGLWSSIKGRALSSPRLRTRFARRAGGIGDVRAVLHWGMGVAVEFGVTW